MDRRLEPRRDLERDSQRGLDERRRAYRYGLRAETLALWALRLKGFRLLARRFRAAGGEIDLILRRGRLVAFVEVKARADLTDALEAVTDRTARRITDAADIWLARNPHFADHDLRFDIVLVAPLRWPHHLADAWRPDR